MEKKKVIIVEDEALIAAEIEYNLEELGYQVIAKAMNGDKALDIINKAEADIAILDINIKGSLNGIDLAKVIKKKNKFPFIFLTSYSDINTLQQVQETMPYGYIVKPFTDKDLRSNIEIALFKFESENSEKNIPRLATINSKIKSPLREREYEVYIKMYEGNTYKEIAEQLFISVNTVKSYQKNLFLKLQVSSRNEAIYKLLNDF
jgi:DNA-binding NarL/FixJ family response regulator